MGICLTQETIILVVVRIGLVVFPTPSCCPIRVVRIFVCLVFNHFMFVSVAG